jgi:hypothetical protein
MKRGVPTSEKRTVRRRLAPLADQADAGGIGAGVTQAQQPLAGLLPAVGSPVIPPTTNEIERFCRVFPRVYPTRGGFQSVRSAPGEGLLCLLVSGFTQRATEGTAPSEAMVPEAPQRPLYRLIHDPLALLGQCNHGKHTPEMAGEVVHARLAA